MSDPGDGLTSVSQTTRFLGNDYTMFLIDTVTLSEIRKTKPNKHVVAWMQNVQAYEMFLSVITLGEIHRGIETIQAKDPDFAKRLLKWVDTLMSSYKDRIISFDQSCAIRWGRLTVTVGNSSADTLIAATALEHGLTVVTRNTKDFKRTGVQTLNPWNPTRKS